MEPNFLLVRFCKDRKYSIISESKLVTLELDINTQKHIGMTTLVSWGHGKNYDAEIISSGAEEDLARLQDDLGHSYLLVNWIKEPSFTVISKSKLVDVGDLLADSDSLIGSTTMFNWTAKTMLEGHILSTGDIQTLNLQLKKAQSDMLAAAGESTSKKGKRKIVDILEGISSVLEQRECQNLPNSSTDSQQTKRGKQNQMEMDEVMLEDQNVSQSSFVAAGERELVSSQPPSSQLVSSQPDFGADTGNHPEVNSLPVLRKSQLHLVSSAENDDPSYWKTLYEKEKARGEIYKNKAQNLQTKLNGYVTEHGEVDLGHGVKIRQSDLDAVYTISNKSTHFARNLMRLLFKEEEMVNRSVFGRKCNANRDMEVKSEIDPKRRDAIIATTLAKFAKTEEAKDAVRRVVIDSMNDFLREKTKKHIP